MPNPSNSDLVGEPPIAQEHRLSAVRGPDHRPDENPWHADCSCGWRSPLMRFAGDAALLGAQHVIDSERLPELAQQLEQAEQREKTLLRWCEEDGGAVKGYICHADLRYLFALTPDEGAEPPVGTEEEG